MDDLGTALVREAGCGVRYVINLEDVDEEQFVVEMDREQAERLYEVLGKMLGKGNPPPFPAIPLKPLPMHPGVPNLPWWHPNNPFRVGF